MKKNEQKQSVESSRVVGDLIIHFPDPENYEREQMIEMLVAYSKRMHIENLRTLCDGAEYWSSIAPERITN